MTFDDIIERLIAEYGAEGAYSPQTARRFRTRFGVATCWVRSNERTLSWVWYEWDSQMVLLGTTKENEWPALENCTDPDECWAMIESIL